MKRNWHLKVISILLAAIIWFYVDANDKPIDKLINIPLVKIGPSKDLALLSETKGGELEPIAMPTQPKTTKTKFGSATVKRPWTYELVDITKVPGKYLMLNTVEVIKAVGVEKIRVISGLRIYRRIDLAYR